MRACFLIGQASPEAGQAALAAGLAATQQSTINFTRANEIEADRIGIRILSRGEFDPLAMAESFEILQRKNRLNTAGLQLEYLRTHPLDSKRIAEASNRAANLQRKSRGEQLNFKLFKARLAVFTSRDTGQLLLTEKANWNRSPSTESAYAITLLHLRANRLDDANEWMKILSSRAADHPTVLLLKAELNAAQGNGRASKKLLETLHALYPERFSILELLLDQLIEEKKLGTVIELANNYIRQTDQPNPRAWRTLAGVQQQLGEAAASHESLA